MYEQNRNINKKVEELKRNLKESLELKNPVTKMKISLEVFKGRFEQLEEWISKFEDKIMETIESEK